MRQDMDVRVAVPADRGARHREIACAGSDHAPPDRAGERVRVEEIAAEVNAVGVVRVQRDAQIVIALAAWQHVRHTGDVAPGTRSAIEPPDAVQQPIRIGDQRIKHIRVVGLHAQRDAPNAARKAGADRRPRIAIGRTKHPTASWRRKPSRHSSGARDDDAGMHVDAPPVPLKAGPRRGHALVEPVVGGGYAVLAIGRIDRDLEKSEARQRRRACLGLPGQPAVIAADRTDAAIQRQGVGDPGDEKRVGVAFPRADIDTVWSRRVNRDCAAREARARKTGRINVEAVHCRPPAQTRVIRAPDAAISCPRVETHPAGGDRDARGAAADRRAVRGLAARDDARAQWRPVVLAGNHRF